MQPVRLITAIRQRPSGHYRTAKIDNTGRKCYNKHRAVKLSHLYGK